MKNLKAILFDFGGTIDTDGIHWSEKYWDAYVACGIDILKEDYEKAYVAAGEDMLDGLISPNATFYQTLFMQLSLQTRILASRNLLNINQLPETNERLAASCYSDVVKTVVGLKPLLERLKTQYRLALVSNFYGNIPTVLKEFHIDTMFEDVIDSSLVGVRKPDPAIWQLSVDNLGLNPDDCLVVGDSYSRDIVPAASIGCFTAWIDGKSWTRPEDTSMAHFTIKSLNELPNIINT